MEEKEEYVRVPKSLWDQILRKVEELESVLGGLSE